MDTFYSLNRTGVVTAAQVVVGASTSGEIIELRVANGQGLSKKDLALALTAIGGRIQQGDAPL